ncbi:uncharacterized protein MELLADRAFT_89223 [Melampsora larici-populina 98AG31]|uniref:Uncharacterized protein n=1 Tax=Melampsora larici-populina (strain 98AG31 / pathotype 3-4-7) TaxID=747676 RepID=F4R5D6_MELLP|nr:uncharacterized protein MELLADRAFT_89223 [Melampsora larici-populina 98AG31]EGG12028.1 hypothetical protein MELLADRAFT_89223 [Melampsora larici-populina 98AG31]
MSPFSTCPSDVMLDQLYYNSPSSSLLKDGITSPPRDFNRQTLQSSAQSEGRVKVYTASRESKQPSRIGSILTVVGLSLTAILPGILGLAFYLSLTFGAPHGKFLSNGTYIRPDDESFALNMPLVSCGIIAPWVMMLFAYHLANHWLKVSRTPHGFQKLPSPFQYFLTMAFINNSTPFSVLRFLIYALKPSPSNRQRLSFTKRRTSRASLSPILLLGFVGLLIVLTFTWSIKVIDVILHDQIVTVVQNITEKDNSTFRANAMIEKGCEDPIFNTCGVLNRTLRASQGGANTSSELQVYQATPLSESRMSFMGPALPDSTISFNSSHTYAAGTVCEAFHPFCKVHDMAIQNCTPGTPPPHGIGRWNMLLYGNGFNTTIWKQRLQVFITEHGNVSGANKKPLTNGANINPFTIATFGCFHNYANITWDDNNQSYPTPFFNWWSLGQGIKNKPYMMCTILICNTTVYDAQYNLTGGKLVLIDNSLTLANASATLAISGSVAYLGTADTDYYQYAPRFLDDQLQVDLTAAGNQYGEDSQLFASAWAQALSNRMIGWSVGAIELQPIIVNKTQSHLATSIPLSTAYLFLGLHILFSIFILSLGISALFLPGILRRDPRITTQHDNMPEDPSQEDLQLNGVTLSFARDKISTPASLIHELMNTRRSQELASSSSALPSISTPTLHRTQTLLTSNDRRQSKRLSEFSEAEQLKFFIGLPKLHYKII